MTLSVITDYSPWQRNLLILNSGNVFVGNDISVYKIVPSPLSASKITAGATLQVLGLQTSLNEVFLHIF